MKNMTFLPYGRQVIDQDDVNEVVQVLESDWLTTGPTIEKFEADLCKYTSAKYAIAVSSGTAALHLAMLAIGIQTHDEVIVPCMSFAASANCIVYCGGKPIFADVNAEDLLIDANKIEVLITSKTKAIIVVDYAGQPCDYAKLQEIARKYNLFLIADSCHALGGKYDNAHVGKLADITCFSFHPVKTMTTGEGGACLTDNEDLAKKIRMLRSHGINTTAREREEQASWYYEMTSLGFNYRITDFQCALGASQLTKLNTWLEKRNELALYYDTLLKHTEIIPLKQHSNRYNAYHLYVVKHKTRDLTYKKLRENNIGANVHYIPIHLHPYYRENFGTAKGLCPNAEQVFEEILTLPLWIGMTSTDVERVVDLL